MLVIGIMTSGKECPYSLFEVDDGSNHGSAFPLAVETDYLLPFWTSFAV